MRIDRNNQRADPT